MKSTKLLNAKIICSTCNIYDLQNYSKIYFKQWFPLKHHQIENAIDDYRASVEADNIELPNNVLYKLRSYGALLLQGQFYVFETDKMERVILTVDMNKLDHIHIRPGTFQIELHDKEQIVSLGVMYEEHMSTWKAAFEQFSVFNDECDFWN